jgi:cellulose synthase (UDP-forming)
MTSVPPSSAVRFAPLTQWAGLLLIVLTVAAAASLQMSWQQQAVFGGAVIAVAVGISWFFRGSSAVFVLVLLSACATARYAWWRYDSLHHYFFSPWSHVDPWNAAAMVLLIGAETYSFLILYLGFVQTIAPLRRPPVPLPEDHALWPTVDVMVPTYNEPLEVVRYTVLAAQEIDWPQDKINVWLLDDGEREEFRAFAEAAGVHYIARPQHNHAKAGNINYALARTSGGLIAIFDSDHIPTRSFLQVTAGWFLRDPKLGMLQTPHHFYSPDPFERNLGHFRQVPNEGELFYGIIQDTNDLWNATFFCGSCAVLRRTALDDVGGIAHETVTEDAHTSFRMHKVGWNTAYINLIQSAGLATESIGDHVKQRVRWARGMAQILRIDCPLFAKGLKLPQRLCYFNAMAHFFYALPRLIFMTSPIFYLVFGKLNIPGYWLTILVYALPHLAMATITNSRIQGEKRHSFWNEIYETVLAPYILLPTMLALISPKLGKFNVTAKGQNKEDDSFDHKMARPFLLLLALNLTALAMAVPRYLYWDRGRPGTILMNVFWTLFNIVVLGVTLNVCWETKQRRTAVRIVIPIPVRLEADGRSCLGVTTDISAGGASILAKGSWPTGQKVEVSFPEEDDESPLHARVVSASAKGVSLAFDSSAIEDQRIITRMLYSRADRWLDWSDSRVNDNPMRSLLDVSATSITGFAKMLRLVWSGGSTPTGKTAYARKVAVIVLLISIILFAFWKVNAEQVSPAGSPHGHAAAASSEAIATAKYQFSLASLGAKNGILLDRSNRQQTMSITLPGTALIESGELHLKYSLPKSDNPEADKDGIETVDVLLNDSALASITPSAQDLARRGGYVVIPLPVDQLVRENRLTLRLAGAADSTCGAQPQANAPIRIDPETQILLEAQRLTVANDLALLPEPFVQSSASAPQVVPFLFAQAPDSVVLQAAGVVASWAGTQVYSNAATFPVKIGDLPVGNVVVFLVGDQQVAGVATPSETSLSVLPNPVDPVAKLLVLRAETPPQLLELAQALALGQLTLSGQSASLVNLVLPSRRLPNDAPRWIHTDRVMLDELAGADAIQIDGSNPLNFYLHFAPDFNFGNRKDMYLHLAYTAESERLDPGSNIQVRLNGNPAGSVPLVEQKGAVTDIPLGDLPAAVFANTLQIQFFAVAPGAKACDANTHFSASISKGSYLDMGGAAHYTTLPNLLLFANAGFPFTRFADLGQTAVLLPSSPTLDEMTLYLDLMGYFGAQTGYPALRIQVAHAGDEADTSAKDLLVLGTFTDLAATQNVAANLPFRFDGVSWSLSRRAQLAEKLGAWLAPLGAAEEGFRLEDNSSPEGIIEDIRSPYASGRSMIFILSKDEAALGPMTAELLAQLPQDGIRNNLSIWQDGRFNSYRLSAPGYSIGDASMVEGLRLLLPQYPLPVALGLLLMCVIFAIWIKISIQRRIEVRLAAPAGELLLPGAD